MKKFLLFSIIIFLFACGTEKKQNPSIREGIWRAKLAIIDSIDLTIPFNFQLSRNNDSVFIIIKNAEEEILVNEISFVNDSVFIRMPIFDSEFRCKLIGDSVMEGKWVNYARREENIIPFKAVHGDENRFDCLDINPTFSFDGKWKCLFGPGQSDSSYAIGIFKLNGHHATGTFLTETGDYRYLEGCAFGNYLFLSCFDGSHAFYFSAEWDDSLKMLWGDFYSGIHFKQEWVAWKDENFKLRNPDSLTFLKKEFSNIDFNFPNLENQKVSLSDEKYKNKVVILQIMGSWCPNCMDETELLAELHKKYNPQGLEIIALCFEKAENLEKAKKNILRLRNKFRADYDFLITGYSPKEAHKALPMLNHVMSFPTTIFIDKKGIVRKIHTGYAGPATEGYANFKSQTASFIEILLKE